MTSLRAVPWTLQSPGFCCSLVSHGATRPLMPVEIIGRRPPFRLTRCCYLCHRSSVRGSSIILLAKRKLLKLGPGAWSFRLDHFFHFFFVSFLLCFAPPYYYRLFKSPLGTYPVHNPAITQWILQSPDLRPLSTIVVSLVLFPVFWSHSSSPASG